MEKLRPQRTWQPGVGGLTGGSGLEWSQGSEGLRHCVLGPCLPFWSSGLWPWWRWSRVSCVRVIV